MSIYNLSELPYDYSALEPYISGKIIELHHDKHHAAYVAGANQAIEQIEESSDKGELAKVNMLEKNLAFNLGGHVNHTAYWQNMAPAGSTEPYGDLSDAIVDQFGSIEKFKAYFTATALGVQGSGWAVLVYDTISEKLIPIQMYDHQANLPVGLIPILLLDVWEHAYYLDYLNVRDDYVSAWWNLVNWKDANERFSNARSIALIK
jgi:Fe-Mn family superoxide dismutase